MDVKRIKFERTGGFTGIRFAADFELDDLPEEQANALVELLDNLDFAKLPERVMSDASMPDQFSYTITVEEEKWKHTVVIGDSSSPEKMQELLQMLNQIARKQAGKS